MSVTPGRICSVDDCDKQVTARGWCATHYARWQRNGAPTLQPKLTDEERFWRYVLVDDEPNECWLWMGGTNGNGYGAFSTDKGLRGAHRVAYDFMVGPIPDGYHLDHLCFNKVCVNPRHLEPVTNTENIRRGFCVSAVNARKAACKYGHPFTEENTDIRPGGGRRCKTCRRLDEAKTEGGRLLAMRDAAGLGPKVLRPKRSRTGNCVRCLQRPADVASARGDASLCEICSVEAWLNHAKERASQVPRLEALLGELLAYDEGLRVA